MTTAEEIKTRAREIMAQDLPEEGGVDSLGFISVLTKLEVEFGAHVPDEEWWEAQSLNALAEVILRNQQPE